MHFNFHFSAAEILWTLTFAAMLVLLVVLLGRDRIRRFPIFTSSIVLVGLNMLADKLLTHRLAPLVSTEVILVLADLGVIIALLLAIELARRAFSGAKWPAWVAGSLVLLGGAAAVIIFWGQWPPAKMVFDPSTLGRLRLMQLMAQKGNLFNEALAVELFALVVIAGRRFRTGWRSHTQQILTWRVHQLGNADCCPRDVGSDGSRHAAHPGGIQPLDGPANSPYQRQRRGGAGGDDLVDRVPVD